MGHYQTGLSLIKQLHLQGVPVDAYTINIGINCYCHLNRVDFGFILLGSLFKRGYEPNVVTFNTLMKGLFTEDKHSEAKNLFTKLVRKKQIEPDIVTYGTVINGLCKSGKTKIAIELLRSMETLNFEADVYCYSMIIDSLCKDRMISDAKNLLVEMTKKGISPNDGKLEIAKELLNELFSNGLQPNARTYNAIINGLCQEGSLDEAKELLMRMEDSGCFPTEVTYNVIVRGFLKKKQTYKAMALLEKMRESGFSTANSTIEMLVERLWWQHRAMEYGSLRVQQENMATRETTRSSKREIQLQRA
ncbi:hypothetical protein LguiA_030506 [Lonicera macranthoides]